MGTPLYCLNLDPNVFTTQNSENFLWALLESSKKEMTLWPKHHPIGKWTRSNWVLVRHQGSTSPHLTLQVAPDPFDITYIILRESIFIKIGPKHSKTWIQKSSNIYYIASYLSDLCNVLRFPYLRYNSLLSTFHLTVAFDFVQFICSQGVSPFYFV